MNTHLKIVLSSLTLAAFVVGAGIFAAEAKRPQQTTPQKVPSLAMIKKQAPAQCANAKNPARCSHKAAVNIAILEQRKLCKTHIQQSLEKRGLAADKVRVRMETSACNWGRNRALSSLLGKKNGSAKKKRA